MRSNTIVLDLETQKTFDEVGRQNLHKLKVSVVGIYDFQDEQFQAYEESQIPELETRLKSANLIVGFNIKRFDMQVLAPYFFSSVDSYPVLDLMEEIEKVRGHRVSLQSLAQGTLDETKSGQGLNAVTLFRQGRMDELKSYCLTDVRITRDVYTYGGEHGSVSFISSRDWKKYDVQVDWRDADKAKKQPAFPTSLF